MINKKNYISKLFGSFVVIMAMFMTVACEKEESVDNLTVETTSNIVLSDLKVNEDGIIAFNDTKEFGSIMRIISTTDEESLDAWENSIGFYSYRSRMDDIVSDLTCFDSESTTESDLFEFANNNNDVLKYVETKEGDNSIDFAVTKTLYSSIANDKGCYIIGDSIYKVSEEIIFSTSLENKAILTELELTKSTELLTNSQVNQTHYLDKSISNQNKYGSCSTSSTYKTAYVTYDDGCFSGRRVIVNMSTYLVVNGSSNDVYVNFNLFGKRKLSCVWIDYATDLTYKYVYGWVYYKDMSWNTQEIYFSISSWGFDGNDESSISTNKLVKSGVWSYAPTFKNCRGEGASRGTNGNYAVIYCY